MRRVCLLGILTLLVSSCARESQQGYSRDADTVDVGEDAAEGGRPGDGRPNDCEATSADSWCPRTLDEAIAKFLPANTSDPREAACCPSGVIDGYVVLTGKKNKIDQFRCRGVCRLGVPAMCGTGGHHDDSGFRCDGVGCCCRRSAVGLKQSLAPATRCGPSESARLIQVHCERQLRHTDRVRDTTRRRARPVRRCGTRWPRRR